MAIDFGNLADGRPFWVGDFNGNKKAAILTFSKGDGNWWMAWFDNANTLQWSLVSNTGFGDVGDGRPVWIANFAGNPRSDVLFYAADANWWIGSFAADKQITWSGSATPAGWGYMANRPLYVGDFFANGTSEVLFYNPGDGNWFLGMFDATGQPSWPYAGINTPSFDVPNANPVLAGNFLPGGRTHILFFHPPSSAWWLGDFFANSDGFNNLEWNPAGSTPGFEVNNGRQIVGDFLANGLSQVLFFHPNTGDWWLGEVDADNQVSWASVGNTSGFGNLNDGRPFLAGKFTGDQAKMLFYSPADGNWLLGEIDATKQLVWNYIGNSAAFGSLAGAPVMVGDFVGAGRDAVMFYYRNDGNWWYGQIVDGSGLQWTLVSNTGAAGDKSFWNKVKDGVSTIANAVITVVSTIVNTALSVVSPITGAIAFVANVLLSVPILGRAVNALVNVAQLALNTVASAFDYLGGVLGVLPEKKLKLLVIVQLDENGQPVAAQADVQAHLAYALSLYKDQANIRIIPVSPFNYTTPFADPPTASADYVYTETRNSNADTLDLNADFDLFTDDLGVTSISAQVGAKFKTKMSVSPAFYNGARSLIGWGSSLCAFAVRSFKNGTTLGCSLGPFADYITVEFGVKNPKGGFSPTPASTLAHEIGHALGLPHRSATGNLMNRSDPPRRPKLTRLQIAWIRTSRFVSYF